MANRARARTRPPEPRWARLLDAADYAGVPHRTMRDWISRGLLPAYRIGPRQIQADLNHVDALRKRIPAANGGKSRR